VAGSRLWAGIDSKDDRSSREEFTIRSTQDSNNLYEAGVRIIIGDENPCNHEWLTVLVRNYSSKAKTLSAVYPLRSSVSQRLCCIYSFVITSRKSDEDKLE
jgi:hypothetical protein